ncbi:MAG: hypothetical protein R3F11_13865 [Verrucomicrobiales bacterium]
MVTTAAKIYYRDHKGLFATPVTQNHCSSHQWLRELKRRGITTISAIQFNIADDTEALKRATTRITSLRPPLASKTFIEHETGLGLEVIIPESIPAKSITTELTRRSRFPVGVIILRPLMTVPLRMSVLPEGADSAG